MQAMVIVPDNANEKPIIADVGSIIKLADQAVFYRDRVSPVTHKANEILIHYGNPKSPQLGWITEKSEMVPMKPSKGPTFLVTTKLETSINAWERFRLWMARARMKNSAMWMPHWLATYGTRHPKELREVVRFFGGKTFKSDSVLDRVQRLFTLIFHTEFDMATLKKNKKGKKGKKAREEQEERTPKSSKKSSKKKASKSSDAKKKPSLSDGARISSRHDEHVIRRLVKENPRRAGTKNAKIWDKLRKGMTVGEFVKKGGQRAAVGYYLRAGWIKLLRPKGNADE
jgi:hypothetical protein